MQGQNLLVFQLVISPSTDIALSSGARPASGAAGSANCALDSVAKGLLAEVESISIAEALGGEAGCTSK